MRCSKDTSTDLRTLNKLQACRWKGLGWGAWERRCVKCPKHFILTTNLLQSSPYLICCLRRKRVGAEQQDNIWELNCQQTQSARLCSVVASQMTSSMLKESLQYPWNVDHFNYYYPHIFLILSLFRDREEMHTLNIYMISNQCGLFDGTGRTRSDRSFFHTLEHLHSSILCGFVDEMWDFNYDWVSSSSLSTYLVSHMWIDRIWGHHLKQTPFHTLNI